MKPAACQPCIDLSALAVLCIHSSAFASCSVPTALHHWLIIALFMLPPWVQYQAACVTHSYG